MGKSVLRIEKRDGIRQAFVPCKCQSLARCGNASRFFFAGNSQTNRQNPAKRIAPKREWTWGHFPKGVMDEEGKD